MFQGQINPESRAVKPTESMFDAKTVECPVCLAPVGTQCAVLPIAQADDNFVITGPNHVERARQARWKKMNLLFEDIQ